MTCKWNSYQGGRAWRRLADGTIVAQAKSDFFPSTAAPDGNGGYVYRTKGVPLTAHTAMQDFGAALRRASAEFDIPVYVLFAMMAIEATKQKADTSHFDPRSCREEPGYVSDLKTPNKVSPGLMQTLLSTAQGENVRRKLYLGPDGELELLTREDLFVPERSIMLGAAYMRFQIDRKEDDELGFDDDDPVLLCSAYNAGSVRETNTNDWHLLTYGESRMDKFIAYNNDMIALGT